ncbi:MAG: hypothetical protein H7X92_12890 [Chitinophagales bacterium]|nr:hypothetical protein [Hyphomicrobiales bacterium]
MPPTVLIIGEDPTSVDFSAPGAPLGMTAEKVTDGLNGSRDRLIDQGYDAHILLTRGDDAERQLAEELGKRTYDVIVIGAGLRTLPPMAAQFEQIMNVLIKSAPHAKLAFNTKPDDSDQAALRHLAPAR